MLQTLSLITPIFALIFSGWFIRKLNIVGSQASVELNKFVVYLGLPALLFDIIAHADWATIWKPSFIACFAISTFVLFIIMAVVQWRKHKQLANASLEALNASYANVGYMGFPLLLSVFGNDSLTLTLTLIATIVTVCILFAASITLVEIGLQPKTNKLKLFKTVSVRVLKNPLIFSPLIACIFPTAGIELPDAASKFLQMLGGAAAPCALVTLGLFLGNTKQDLKTIKPTTLFIVTTKLFVHPALTWVLAVYVFNLPDTYTFAAVLLAALPTGTGPFMLAEFYGRDAQTTSKVILITTLLSILTLTPLISAMQ